MVQEQTRSRVPKECPIVGHIDPVGLVRQEERLIAMHASLDRIEAAVTATNGRVRELEKWKISVEASSKVVGLVGSKAAALALAGVSFTAGIIVKWIGWA